MYTNSLERLYQKLTRILVITVITFATVNSFSLNLGRINTNSMMGENFNADIVLEGIPKGFSAKDLTVTLANQSEYKKVGLYKETYHDDLTFNVYKDTLGQWNIRVKSVKPIHRQFVNFLVTAKHPRGKIVREYLTILKNPIIEKNKPDESVQLNTQKDSNFALSTVNDKNAIVRNKAQADLKKYDNHGLFKPNTSTENKQSTVSNTDLKAKIANNINKTINKADVNTKVKAVVSSQKPAAVIVHEAPNKPIDIKIQNHKTVKKGDSLWEIAKEYSQSNRASKINKLMIAIYKTNKDAFINNNIALLKAGKKIQIPDNKVIDKINYPEEAYQLKLINKQQYIALNNQIGNSIRNNVSENNTKITLTKDNFNSTESLSNLTKNSTGNSTQKITINKNTIEQSRAIKNQRITKSEKVVNNSVKQDTKKSKYITDKDSGIIRISAIDGNINKLQVIDDSVPVSKTTEVNKNPSKDQIATKTNGKFSNDSNVIATKSIKELSKSTLNLEVNKNKFNHYSTIEQDIAKLNKDLDKQYESRKKQKRLKIIAKQDPVNKTNDSLLLSAEKLVAKQKQNKELKQELLILKAQLNDMKRLLALKNKEINATKNLAFKTIDSLKRVKNSDDDLSAANNPLVPFDVASRSNYGSNITMTDAVNDIMPKSAGVEQAKNTSHNISDKFSVIKHSISNGIDTTQDAVSSYISKIASDVTNLMKTGNIIGKDTSNKDTKFILWAWVIGISMLFSMLFIYFYWARNFKKQTQTPEFMNESEDLDPDSADYPYEDLEFNSNDGKIT